MPVLHTSGRPDRDPSLGDPEIGIRNAFVAVGDQVYFELIETADGSQVRVYDDVFGHGLQMICIECDDVDAVVVQLRADYPLSVPG